MRRLLYYWDSLGLGSGVALINMVYQVLMSDDPKAGFTVADIQVRLGVKHTCNEIQEALLVLLSQARAHNALDEGHYFGI